MFDPSLLHQYLERSAQRFPDKKALASSKKTYTYSELLRDSRKLAIFLMSQNVNRGDRIIIFLDNSPEVIISLFATLMTGGVFVILNGAIKAPKLKYIIEDCSAKAIITHNSKIDSVQSVLQKLKDRVPVIIVDESEKKSQVFEAHFWENVIQNNAFEDSGHIRFPRCIDSDLASLIYTSGSTGQPKGVMSTHLNMISAAKSIISYIRNTPDDIILSALPLSFDYGLYQVIMSVLFGGTVIIRQSFTFVNELLKTINEERVTGFPIVPTIVALLLKIKNIEKYDLSSLKYITNTGAALSNQYIDKLRQYFPNTKIFSMYGLTECKRVSYLPPDKITNKPTSVGIPMPNCEVFIVDDKGNKLDPCQVGELVIRGTNVMQGYWNSPDITSQYFRSDFVKGERVLFSGDLFKQDKEGYLYFIGRKDDLIKTKGERVSPKEIENVILNLDGVLEVAVVGIPDNILGMAIKAFIVNNEGTDINNKQILKYCSENMEIFMIPKYIKFIDSLPRSPNGKIDKKKLELKLSEPGD